MRTPAAILLVLLQLHLGAAHAETVKDREGAVRKDKATMENDPRWIYNDFQQGFAEARRTGKPLLVALRCVPCLACAGIDAQVLLKESELDPLLDQFVCVRVINANALDLSLFQFDFDLSFSTLFFNGDGTVYGRYGSWTHQKNPQDKTTAGFKRALEQALAIHKEFPSNKNALAGKQGRPTVYKTPVEIPSLAGKYSHQLDWAGKVVQSCVHCHQIGDAFRARFREQRKPIPQDLIFPWPAPETIGISLAPDHPARVHTVTPGSPAGKAGLQPGDDLLLLENQPLVSIADVSWILQSAPEKGGLAASIRRGNTTVSTRIDLPDGWRAKSDISRRVGTWQMRGMATGGLVLEDLPSAQRKERGLDDASLGLRVSYVGEYGTHAAAKKAGFRKDDLIVEIDGLATRMSEGELIGHLLKTHPIGDSVKATVLRGSERLTLQLPMQ